MKKDTAQHENKNTYKIIISELGVSPFRMLKVAFALMGIIPLLVLFYVIIGRKFLYDLFLGSNGFIIGFAVVISVIGFIYAYSLVRNMIKRLLLYSSERKRSDEEKTELLLAVSHDLQIPLTTIKTGIQELLDGIGGVIGKMHTRIAEICLNAANKMMGFVNELLDVSSLTLTRVSLKRELINFSKLVEDEVSGISELSKKNNQEIAYRSQAYDPNIWGDGEKLSRVVMNLLSNAVKYTPKSGKIDVALSDDTATIKLAVKNTGPGIMPDELEQVFAKYSRLKKHSGIKGTGLGLSIAKEIVDLHNGHIAATSEPGKLTEFDITLPRDLRAKKR